MQTKPVARFYEHSGNFSVGAIFYLKSVNQLNNIFAFNFSLISALPSGNPLMNFGRAALLGLSGGESGCDAGKFIKTIYDAIQIFIKKLF